jgi:hypothetical protein
MPPRRRPYGTGSVHRLPSGRWRAQLRLPDGTRQSLGSFATKQAANTALLRAKGRVLAEGPAALGDQDLVRTWAERWLTAGEGRWKPRTAYDYRKWTEAHVLP